MFKLFDMLYREIKRKPFMAKKTTTNYWYNCGMVDILAKNG